MVGMQFRLAMNILEAAHLELVDGASTSQSRSNSNHIAVVWSQRIAYPSPAHNLKLVIVFLSTQIYPKGE